MFHLWKVVKQWLQCSVFCDVAFSHLQHCEEQPLPLPPALSLPPPLNLLLSTPFVVPAIPPFHRRSTLPHTVRGASLFPFVSLSFFPSVSLWLCLALSPPSCVQFLYATKSPKCASHIVGYKLVARAEEHSCRLALEMRLSLLYHWTVSKTHGVIIEHRN